MVAVEPDVYEEAECEDEVRDGSLYRGEWLSPSELENRMFAVGRLAEELGSLPGDESSEWVGFWEILDTPELWIGDEQEYLWGKLEGLL